MIEQPLTLTPSGFNSVARVGSSKNDNCIIPPEMKLGQFIDLPRSFDYRLGTAISLPFSQTHSLSEQAWPPALYSPGLSQTGQCAFPSLFLILTSLLGSGIVKLLIKNGGSRRLGDSCCRSNPREPLRAIKIKNRPGVIRFDIYIIPQFWRFASLKFDGFWHALTGQEPALSSE